MKEPNLASAVVHKYAYELRYDFGFGYLDRCGDILNSILKENPGWMVAGAITPGGTTLTHRESGMAFAFDNNHLTLGQDQSEKVINLLPHGEFAKVAEKLTGATIDRIETEALTRVGFRVWRLYGASTKQEAQEAVKTLGYVKLGPLTEAVEGADIEEVGFNCTFALPEMLLRLAIAVVEQNIPIDPATVLAAKARVSGKDSRVRKAAAVDQLKARNVIAAFPQHAVLMDMDFFIEDPPIPADIRVAEFITSAFDMSERFSSKILRGASDEHH